MEDTFTEVLETFQVIDEKNGSRPPTPCDWARHDDTPFSEQKMLEEFPMDWDQLLLESGCITEQQVQTSQQPFTTLWFSVLDVREMKFQRDNGGSHPTLYEVCDTKNIFPDDFAVYFDSWSSVLQGCMYGDDLSPKCGDITREELLREAARVRHEMGELTQTAIKQASLYSFSPFNNKFDGMDDIREQVGVPNDGTVTREKLINDLHRVENELGHPPTSVDVHKKGKYSHSTYLADGRWDTWADVLDAAGMSS